MYEIITEIHKSEGLMMEIHNFFHKTQYQRAYNERDL